MRVPIALVVSIALAVTRFSTSFLRARTSSPRGLDDPAFVTAMSQFVRAHPRTELISYFSGRPGSIFDLASKPRSLAAYRQSIVPLG